MLTADLEKAEKDVTTLKRENERLADEKATLQEFIDPTEPRN